ncbi:MAG: glutamate--tRNA ligase [Proteobacteria bacterium]|nr:glutamate--tRNA ligase [Pseudomonadota bacterium]
MALLIQQSHLAMTKQTPHIKTRFAPSPTGFLHIGGLRTALFSYLFAKKHQGSFLLRIEDTDRERLKDGADQDILAALKWCGLNWDGEVHWQSQRRDHYQKYVKQLLDEGHAYPCFCSRERLLSLRSTGDHNQGYDRACRNLPQDKVASYIKEGKPYVVRLKMPLSGQVTVRDEVLGEIVYSYREFTDTIMMKSDGYPTYHLAHVVDDELLGITHVLRGQEWLSSYPIHHFLWQKTGFTPPQYIHLPLILSESGGKLSKRKNQGVSVEDYKDLGYLPEALINFLALLGWSYDDKRTFFSLEELTECFSIQGIAKSNATFSLTKLNYLNQHYIGKLSQDSFQSYAHPILQQAFPTRVTGQLGSSRVEQASLLYQSRLQYFKELETYLSFFGSTDLAYAPSLFDGLPLSQQEVHNSLLILETLLAQTAPWEEEVLTHEVKQATKAKGVKMFELLMPLRLAVTGSQKSPSILALVIYLGKESTLARVKALMNHLASSLSSDEAE